jgi:patatin-related protein
VRPARLSGFGRRNALTQGDASRNRDSSTQSDNRSTSDYQELRLALAMSGGVSLAVWMGGVAMEIYRLVRSDPSVSGTDDLADSVYRGLLDLTRTTPRVDIIAGASAGGLNGAFLALAMVHRSDLSILRSLWLEKASLIKMFRSPLAADPPSLLKGDEYFLPELRAAFEALQEGAIRPEEDVPIRLIMTTTLLSGDTRTFADDFGSLLPDVVHAAQFRFRRGAGEVEDDFVRKDILDRLALAARSTASFPGAFEASFVPVGERTRRPPRPDMKGHIIKGDIPLEESRFVVDGGVLVNKPLAPVLRAIFAQPAGEQLIRRVFAYVVPDPGVAGTEQPDAVEDIPSMSGVVIRSLVTAPRAQSVAGDLDRLAEHNRRAKGQQLLRDRLLRPPEQGADLARLARDPNLFEAYRKLRAANIVDGVLARQDPLTLSDSGLADEAVRILRWLVGTGNTRWMPTGENRDDEKEGWPWGAETLESVGTSALDLIRRGINLCRPRHSRLAGFRSRLGRLREQVHGDLARARPLRRLEQEEYLPAELEELLAALRARGNVVSGLELQRWLGEWMSGRSRFEEWLRENHPDQASPRDVGEDLASRLLEARPILLEAAGIAPDAVDRKSEVGEWKSLEQRIEGSIPESRDQALEVLVDLAIVQLIFTAGMPVLEQPVDFIQISGDSPNGLDSRKTVGEKVAGIQLGHFGSFYKSSWRANDWMWGRVDGAMRLTQVLLNPLRLRERLLEEESPPEKPVDWALEQIERLAVPPRDSDSHSLLAQHWDRDRSAARIELGFLSENEGPVPGSLPVCAGAIARRLQLELLREELPVVAEAIESDRVAGAAVPAPAGRFAAAVKGAVRGDRLSPDDAARLFRLCRVGQERMKDEVGSDMFTSTAAQAMAVGVSAGAGSRGGLGPLRGLVRSVRNLFIALYLLARSAVSGKGGFALASALLAVGGAIIAVGVTDLAGQAASGQGFPTGWLDWLGILIVGAGVLLMALRAGLLIAVVYVAVAAVLAWWPYTYVRDHYGSADGIRGWLYDVRFAIPIVVLVVASACLGFVRRSAWWKTLAAVAALAWIGVLGFLAVRDSEQPWVLIGVSATTLVIGFALAWWIRRDQEIGRHRAVSE